MPSVITFPIANGVVVGNHERFEAIREDRADCFLSDKVDRFGFEATLEGLLGDMLDRHHHSQSGVVGKEANKAKRGVILPGSLEINRGDSTGGIVAASGRFVLLLGFTHWERTKGDR